MASDTRARLLDAARTCLLDDGYAAFSTRRVADRAGVPLSQIHYHFGGKQGLVLALFGQENDRLLERQTAMYATDLSLSKRYEQACQFLEEDLASGYVRVLQEMIAAGWSDPAVASQVTTMLARWFDLLAEVAGEAARSFDGLGSFTPQAAAMLIGMSFLGAEALLLLGDQRWAEQVFDALREIGNLIRTAEQSAARPAARR
jgi:AcrR family transcriptional regulator